jgi:hypothetical protein
VFFFFTFELCTADFTRDFKEDYETLYLKTIFRPTFSIVIDLHLTNDAAAGLEPPIYLKIQFIPFHNLQYDPMSIILNRLIRYFFSLIFRMF